MPFVGEAGLPNCEVDGEGCNEGVELGEVTASKRRSEGSAADTEDSNLGVDNEGSADLPRGVVGSVTEIFSVSCADARLLDKEALV